MAKQTCAKQDRQGFTLVEITIVLIIIALLAGGVLIGREIIIAARINQQIAQVKSLTTAVGAFKEKYDCLPGDCAGAVGFGLGTSASYHNGDDNEKIDTKCAQQSVYSHNNYQKESFNFYLHLSNAGMIGGSYQGYQGEAHNSSITTAIMNAKYLKGTYSGTYIVPSQFNTTSGYCATANYEQYLREGGNGYGLAAWDDATNRYGDFMPKDEMRRLDEKMDDGLPLQGNVGIAGRGNGVQNNWINLMGATYGNCNKTTYAAITNVNCDYGRPVFVNQF